MRAVDFSAYQGPPPRPWQALRDAGVGLVIVEAYGGGPSGTGPNPWCRQDLIDAFQEGFATAAYTWPPSAWRQALAACGEMVDQLQFLALDVEAGAPLAVAQLQGVTDAGVSPVVYTSRGEWTRSMGDSAEFAVFPLWDASYFSDLDIANWPENLADRFVPYGGWQICIGWQFRRNSSLGGLTVDLNTFKDTFILPRRRAERTRRDLAVIALDIMWGNLENLKGVAQRLEEWATPLSQVSDDQMLSALASVVANTAPQGAAITLRSLGTWVKERAAEINHLAWDTQSHFTSVKKALGLE